MAIHDHTARARASVHPDASSTFSPNLPFYLDDPDEPPERQRAQRHEGIALVINELKHLIAFSDIDRLLQARNLTVESQHWPLPAASIEGLHAAIHYLGQYAQSVERYP